MASGDCTPKLGRQLSRDALASHKLATWVFHPKNKGNATLINPPQAPLILNQQLPSFQTINICEVIFLKTWFNKITSLTVNRKCKNMYFNWGWWPLCQYITQCLEWHGVSNSYCWVRPEFSNHAFILMPPSHQTRHLYCPDLEGPCGCGIELTSVGHHWLAMGVVGSISISFMLRCCVQQSFNTRLGSRRSHRFSLNTHTL